MPTQEHDLVRAARDGQLPTVRRLLDLRVAIDALDERGWTALQSAAYEGHVAVVEFLLEKGASVTARTPDGQTPLMMAAYNGSSRVVEALLERGAAVNDEDSHGWTPLMFVTIYRHGKEAHVIDLATRLLGRGANATTTNHAGWNAAMMAAKNGMAALEELLLRRISDQQSGTGRRTQTTFVSLIDFVSSLGREFPEDADTHIDALLANGCDINESRQGTTPLDCAARQDNAGIIKSLVRHGADINSPNPMGRTPLLNAAVWGKADALQALLECGADPNIADSQGGTALDAARDDNNLNTVRILLDAGSDPNAQDVDGNSILMKAVLNGQNAIATMLIEHGADTSARNRYGQTIEDMKRMWRQ